MTIEIFKKWTIMICVLVSSFFAPAEWNQNLNDLAKRAAVAWVESPLNFLNSSIT